jgi:hypothetical protein
MAGSKRWFVYTMDDGTNVGIIADESNTEAVNGGAANPPTAGSAPTRQLPKGTKIRSVYYANAAGTRVIKIAVLNQTIYNGIPANFATITDPITGTGTLGFLRKRPEIVKAPAFGIDTGLTDGDSPG